MLLELGETLEPPIELRAGIRTSSDLRGICMYSPSNPGRPPEDNVNIGAIRAETAKALGVSVDDVTYIDEASIAESEQVGKDASKDPDMSLLRTWTGNNFQVRGRQWWFQDTPGSQCGRTRWWYHDLRGGETVRTAGNCPQGYAWVSMELPGT